MKQKTVKRLFVACTAVAAVLSFGLTSTDPTGLISAKNNRIEELSAAKSKFESKVPELRVRTAEKWENCLFSSKTHSQANACNAGFNIELEQIERHRAGFDSELLRTEIAKNLVILGSIAFSAFAALALFMSVKAIDILRRDANNHRHSKAAGEQA